MGLFTGARDCLRFWRFVESRANCWLLVIFIVNLYFTVLQGVSDNHSRLNQFILHYEPVIYEGIPLAQVEKGNDEIISYRFQAFGRSFALQLTVGSSVLPPFARIEIHDQNKTKYEAAAKVRRCLVEGRLSDDPLSFAHGDIHEGIFDGIITVQKEQYYVEPSTIYFEKPVPFKSVIFRRSDINFTALMGPKEGSSSPYKMDFVTGPTIKEKNHSDPFQKRKPVWINEGSSSTNSTAQRIKRQAWGNSTCSLKIIADHSFFQFTTDHTVEKAVAEMVALVYEVNNTFYNTDFNYDLHADRISLMVKSVTVYKSQSDANYKLFEHEISANDFLTVLSEYDFSEYCIGVVFTHREFPNNVLGLAYTGSPDQNVAGGICQKRIRNRSYNVAMTSSLGRTGRLPRAMKIITLAHEIGHNFGSSHDPDTNECSPSDNSGGVYIMSPYAGSGDLRNHMQFSPCSKRSITDVVTSKGFCLTPISTTGNAVCGNGIKEGNEECDCGSEAQCSEIDPCCSPQGNEEEPECTIRRNFGYLCSFRQGPCCTSTCQLVPVETETLCNENIDCTEPATCDGVSEYCPPTVPVVDGRPCHNGLGACLKGVCKTTVCLRNEMEDCECPHLNLACHICCQLGDICEPAADLGLHTEQSPLLKLDHELCDHGRGTCLSGKCKVVGHMGSPGEGIFREGMPTTEEPPFINKVKFPLVIATIVIVLLVIVVIVACILRRLFWVK